MENSPQLMIILLVFAAIGALDELYYHSFKLKILHEKNCYRENTLHIARGFLFFLVCHLVAFVQLSGTWVIFGLVVLGVDLILSVMDIIEEPISRKHLGGLPRGEYLLHMCLAFLLGIFYFNYIQQLIANFGQTTGFTFAMGPSPLLRVLVSVVGFLSLGISLYGTYQLSRLAERQ